jgi:hypothetical protein
VVAAFFSVPRSWFERGYSMVGALVTVWLELGAWFEWLQCDKSVGYSVVTAWLVWLQYGWSVDTVWLELG